MCASENNKFLIAGVGELLWDLFPTGFRMGGAPGNFAYHCHELGADSVVLSCVGDDEQGKEIIAQLKLRGLKVDYIATSNQWPTGTVSVILDSQKVPSYVITENVAWDFIPWKEEYDELATRVDAVCFGSLAQRSDLSRQTIQRFLALTPEDCLRVFDINLRQSYYSKEIIESSLFLTDVLKLNEEELSVLADLLSLHGTESQLPLELLQKYQLKVIALTRGGKGAALITPDDTFSHQGYPVENIVDTVGAGDSFTAALVLGLLSSVPLPEILENSNRLASYVCTRSGAMPPHPDDRFRYKQQLSKEFQKER